MAGRGCRAGRADGRRRGRSRQAQDLPVDELHRQRLAGRGRQHGQGHGRARDRCATRSTCRSRSPAPTPSARSSRSTPWCSRAPRRSWCSRSRRPRSTRWSRTPATRASWSSPTTPRSPSPAPTTSRSTRRRPAGSPPSGWWSGWAARATSWRSPACPALRSTRCAPRPRRRSSPSIPTSRSSAEADGMWSQAVARTELSKILATQTWDEIDGLWMQAGCFTANSMQLEAGKTARAAAALRRRGLEWRPHPDAADRHRGRGRQRHLRADAAPAHLLRLAALFRRLALKLAVQKLEGKDVPKRTTLPLPRRHQRHGQAVPGRHLGGDEGGLQRVPAVARLQSRAGSPRSSREETPEIGLQAALVGQPEDLSLAGCGERPSALRACRSGIRLAR